MSRDQPSKDDTALMVVESQRGHVHHHRIADLAELLRTGDLVVVNDAATLPASLPIQTNAGDSNELRLASGPTNGLWPAVLFGPGDWRTRTEDRQPPQPVVPGQRLEVAPDFFFEVIRVSDISPRLIYGRFSREGSALWQALYRHGRVIQYAHRDQQMPLWDVQTGFGARPWAVEMPSAGRPLSWTTLSRMRRRGIEVRALTHGAGLSATGDVRIDRALPLPELYDLPAPTAKAIATAQQQKRRIIAVGTTVVRALESAAARGLSPGLGVADNIVTPNTRLQVVSGILSGIHEPGESHFRLLGAFCSPAILERAAASAKALAYRNHELGDACLIVPRLRQRARRRPPREPSVSFRAAGPRRIAAGS